MIWELGKHDDVDRRSCATICDWKLTSLGKVAHIRTLFFFVNNNKVMIVGGSLFSPALNAPTKDDWQIHHDLDQISCYMHGSLSSRIELL